MYRISFMLKLFFLILFNLLLIFTSLSAEIINTIKISGNNRITDETIKVFSNIKINQIINESDLDEILKKLYDTGFFSDVRISLYNNQLNIDVVENKIVQSVTVNGVKNKNLIEAITNLIKTNEKKSYIQNNVNRDIDNIKNFLKISGYYFAQLNLDVKNNSNNSVDLIFNVDLGQKAVVEKINFTGDKVFKNSILRNVIVSEESKFWKIISKKKFLNESQINLDERLLKNFYLNNGYYNVKINSTSASVVNKNKFKLIYNINAGQKYFFNNLELVLPLDYDQVNFSNLNKILKETEKSPYSLNKVQNILDEIDKIALSKEFEFINAKLEETLLDNNKINIKFVINESKKIYVNRIDFFGNDITNESAIRDFLVVDEGDPFNEILNNRSLNNLKSSGLFSNVQMSIINTNDEFKKNIIYQLKEQPTGEISAGAGYGTSGQTISFAIKENNFNGNGVKLNTSFSISTNSIKGGLNLNIPNYNYSEKSLRLNLSRTDTDNFDTSGYKNDISNFTIGTGFEYKEDLYFTPMLEFEYENLETNSNASSNLKKQDGSYSDVNLDYSFLYDKRNQTFQPSNGFYSNFNQILPVISNNYSLKNNYDFKIYKQLTDNVVGNFSFFLSTVNSIEGNDVRISERLNIPSRKLRGFEKGKVGPKDNNDFIGGNYISGISLSSSIPSFLPDLEEMNFNFFVDAANIWGVDYNSSLDDSSIKSSAGLSIDWLTPIGPLNFTLAQPITKDSSDISENFRFDIGTTF